MLPQRLICIQMPTAVVAHQAIIVAEPEEHLGRLIGEHVVLVIGRTAGGNPPRIKAAALGSS